MSKRFPHLQKANSWPGLSTVDPFDLQVTFDPYLWTADVEIHLCRTHLDAGYENIGGWTDAESRDSWFESHSDTSIVLDSEMHVLPGQEIKLPLSFDVLNHYNQLYIDFPPQPTAGGASRPYRYYYFVEDVQYRSPSATACIITVDEWSTHMFEVDFDYILLERGHAPMAAITADDYLRNPLANCDLLTTADENAGGATKLAHAARHVVNSGPHWLVFSMTADATQDPGTFGHRENWRVPTTSATRVQGAISPTVFAIEPGDANTMINRINERAPQLMPAVQAVFLIPKRYVQVQSTFSFLDMTCRSIEPIQHMADALTLSKSMFGYPAQYADIAKLYTQPYSWIEIVDETGRSRTIAIEETTGRLRVSTIASILAPFLGVDCYVLGIGSGEQASITWDNFTSHTFEAYGDWTTSLRHWNVPTYAIIQNSERAFEWLNYWQRQQSKLSIDTGYDLGIATNNLNYSLRNASLDRQLSRLSQEQANGRSQLSLSQGAATALNNINIDKMDADLESDMYLNSYLSSLTNQEFALAASNANASSSNQIAQAQVAQGLSQSYRDYVSASGTLSMAQGAIDLGGNLAMGIAQEASVDTQLLGHQDDVAIQTAYNALSDSVSLMQTYEDTSYANLSAEAGVQTSTLQLQGAQIQAQNVQATYTMAMSNQANTALASNNTASEKRNHAANAANRQLQVQNNLASNSLSTQQSYQTAILQGDVALNRSQIGATKGMSDRSVTARRDLGDESLANSHRAGRLGSPKVFAQPTGSMANYTRPQALMFQIKTQDAGSIATAGDAFLRYGYRMGGRQWTVTTLTPMAKFSYWQGDAQIGGGKVNEVTRRTIKSIFANGTTVWTNPALIGVTSIYDN